MRAKLRGLVLVALWALAACAVRDTVATATTSQDVVHCSASGPPVLSDGTCTGALASAVFRGAVCACDALQLSAQLTTDGFDSQVGPYAPGGGGGDVGANLMLSSPGVLGVGGNLTVGGAVQAGTELSVSGDLAVQGELGRPSSLVSVGGAARIGGGIRVAQLEVGGALTTPAGAVEEGVVKAAQRQVADVSVAAACRCGADNGVDVASIVDAHSRENDNDAVGVSKRQFENFIGDTLYRVPCGLVYLENIQSADGSTLTLSAAGRSAVVVRNEIAPLKIEIEPGAELDLFVEGPLNLAAADVGTPERPWALRIYKAWGGDINVPGDLRLYGSIYAPEASLASSGRLEVFGALVVRNLTGGGERVVHYDRALAAAAQACR